MQLIVVRRSAGGNASESIEVHPVRYSEPVALIIHNATLSRDEITAIGQVILEKIKDQPINAAEILALYEDMAGT